MSTSTSPSPVNRQDNNDISNELLGHTTFYDVAVAYHFAFINYSQHGIEFQVESIKYINIPPARVSTSG